MKTTTKFWSLLVMLLLSTLAFSQSGNTNSSNGNAQGDEENEAKIFELHSTADIDLTANAIYKHFLKSQADRYPSEAEIRNFLNKAFDLPGVVYSDEACITPGIRVFKEIIDDGTDDGETIIHFKFDNLFGANRPEEAHMLYWGTLNYEKELDLYNADYQTHLPPIFNGTEINVEDIFCNVMLFGTLCKDTVEGGQEVFSLSSFEIVIIDKDIL